MDDIAAINSRVARNLRLVRGARDLTLDQLAKKSGVSKGMLVQIEQGRTNPSIATLCRVANALGVAVARFVEVGEAPMVRLRGAGEAAGVWRGGAGRASPPLLWGRGPRSCARLGGREGGGVGRSQGEARAERGCRDQRTNYRKAVARRQLAPPTRDRQVDRKHAIGEHRLDGIHPCAKPVRGNRIGAALGSDALPQ